MVLYVRFPRPRIPYPERTVYESVHKMTLGTTGNDVMAFRIQLTNLARITAPSSSNLGMDCFLTGMTLVFEATNCMSHPPYMYTVRKYTTAAYALQDASENPCSSKTSGFLEMAK